MYEFAVTSPVTVAAKIASGELEIIAEERASATVEVRPWDDSSSAREAAGEVRVELAGDRLLVETPSGFSGARWLFGRGGKVRVRVRTPLDSPVEARLASCDVTGRGRFGPTMVHTASGDVRLDEVAGDLSATVSSGDLSAERIVGAAVTHSASGDVRIGEVGGELSATTASGDVRVVRVGGSLTARTASGDVTVDAVDRGEVRVHTVSGDVRVGVQRGTRVWLDLDTTSGRTTTELDHADAPPEAAGGEGGQLSLRVRTVSGDIKVGRA